MDLSELKPSERMLEILTPGTKKALGVRVSILHLHDAKLKRLRAQMFDDNQRLQSRGKFIKSEDFENKQSELCFAAMTGWEWYSPTGKDEDTANFRGEIPEFTRKNVFEIFNDANLFWFRDQISEAISETEDFFRV